MSISFFGLDIAITGMAASQKSLEVTGHNVANLGTPGFARQSAVLVGAQTRAYGNWRVEMGVDVQQIRQIRDLFQDNLVRTANNALGYWETRHAVVEDLQAVLGEPMKEGLQAAMNHFWDSWQELSKAPENLTIRSLVRQRSESLVRYVNHTGSQLNKLQADLNLEVYRRIEEVNDITEQVRDLNIKITSAEAAGNLPNDFYDQRNLLVDRLSKLVTANTNVSPDGQMDIMVGGYFLVAKGIQTNLVAASNDLQSNFFTPRLEGYDVDVNVGQGIIQGLLEGRGVVSGAAGNPDNGSPNTQASITVLRDTVGATITQQADIMANLFRITQEMQRRGLTPTLTVVDYDGSEAGLQTALDSVITSVPVPGSANRFLLIATDQNIGGDGAYVSAATVSNWATRLRNSAIHTSVLTNSGDYASGDIGEPGWRILAEQTHGGFFDMSNLGAGLMAEVGTAMAAEVDTRMATQAEGTNIVSAVRRQLNSMLNRMMREVNLIHRGGTTLNGLAGSTFFEPINPNQPLEMGNIRLNSNLSDINNIVAGQTDANGDNSVALKIAGLRNELLMTGRTMALSLDTFYQNIILQVGNTGFDAESIMSNQRRLSEQAEAIRQSIMGVSLDEEMANMIKFRFAYNASARNISVVDEMIDTIMNRMGAGR